MTTTKNLFKPATPPKVGAGAEVPAPLSSQRGEPIPGEADRPRRRLEPMDDGEADLPTIRDYPNLRARAFAEMLEMVSKDGDGKRRTGTIPSPWWRDDRHFWKIFNHIARYLRGEKADPDSGAHPMAHVAWRALCVAYQETQGKVNPAYLVEHEGLVVHAIPPTHATSHAHMDELSKTL